MTDDHANPNLDQLSSSSSSPASTPTPGSNPVNVYKFCNSHSRNRTQLHCQYERKSSDSYPCSRLTSRQPPFLEYGHQLNQPATSSGRPIAESTGNSFTGRPDGCPFYIAFVSLFQPCPSQRAQMPRSQAAVSSWCCWERPQ